MQRHLVIPARLSSTRLPNKPLQLIHGVPLILRVAQQVYDMFEQSTHYDSWTVATDDDSIKKLCEAYDVPVILTAKHHPSGTDRLAEVATLKNWSNEDIVINIQGDEPFIPQELVAQVSQLLIDQPDCAVATLFEPIKDEDEYQQSSVVKVVSSLNGQALYFSRSPIPHQRDATDKVNLAHHSAKRHLGLYAYRVGLLHHFTAWSQSPLEQLESLEQLRILEHGYKIAIAKACTQLPAGIDTPQDLARVNAMPQASFAPFNLSAKR